MNQVHKESLTLVENALPNRQGLEVEIFGMEGIPEDVVQQHNQRLIQNFYQAQADRFAATGNPPPGQSGKEGPVKKIKIETADEIKKRLADHRARVSAQKAANGGVANPTPPLGLNGQSPGQNVSISRSRYDIQITDNCLHRTHRFPRQAASTPRASLLKESLASLLHRSTLKAVSIIPRAISLQDPEATCPRLLACQHDQASQGTPARWTSLWLVLHDKVTTLITSSEALSLVRSKHRSQVQARPQHQNNHRQRRRSPRRTRIRMSR